MHVAARKFKCKQMILINLLVRILELAYILNLNATKSERLSYRGHMKKKVT